MGINRASSILVRIVLCCGTIDRLGDDDGVMEHGASLALSLKTATVCARVTMCAVLQLFYR